MIKIYGIPNCDSTKKAFAWLSQHKLKFEFHDYKKEGITKDKITEWLLHQPIEILLNRKGTTWKGLTGVAQKKANNQNEAIKLMVENTSLIKRPVIEKEGLILVGFNTEAYEKALL